jgi:hypothetical protein
MASSASRRIFLQSEIPADAFGLTEIQLAERIIIESEESQKEAAEPQARRA